MIKMESVYKSFNSKSVLKGVSLDIKKGESLCIVGSSGVGKSVLLKMMVGLLYPDNGKIFFESKIVNELSFKNLQELRSKIGMVFQFGALFDSMTVYDNISLVLKKIFRLNQMEINKKVKDCLQEVGMEDTQNLMPAELSGGMKKRVGIARALAINPEYILYDEPTTGLDPIMADTINKLIKKFHTSKKITSIIVTHDMKTVQSVSDRVIMIHKGEVHFDGRTEDLIKSKDKIIQDFVLGVS